MPFQKGNKLGKNNLGKKRTVESCLKMSRIAKGRIFSDEHKRKIGLSRIGDKHPLWAGDKVSYGALHSWVKRHLQKPLTCNDCGEIKPLDLANISQKYKRDLSDFKWLCRKCHMTEDGRLFRRKGGKYSSSV